MIFSPFMDHRYAWDLVFIIDLIFSGIIFIPFFISLFLEKKSRWVCRGSMIGLSLYILLCWFQNGRAMKLTEVFAHSLNEEVIQVASLPQPLSPFRWAIFIETNDKIYQGFVDFLREERPESVSASSSFFEKLNRLYDPPEKINYRLWTKLQDSPWVEKALATEGVEFYYWFARFPVVKSVNFEDGRHRVEFIDLRFSMPEVRMPFRYYVEFDHSGRIYSEGFVEDRKKQRE
ncbi:MAG: hypothetical protein A2169_14750 [Deltaproteobacteria bacterium RBG_13_47_9]|nr:MAG: hypothetical protein A2169_14750 [Deltaproteobacteria bacterium RBG_13_47_9]